MVIVNGSTRPRRVQGPAMGRTQVLRALHELSVATGGVLDPHALAREVAFRTAELLQVDKVSLYLVDATGLLLTPAADLEASPWRPAQPRVAGRGVIGQAVSRRKTLVVNDYPRWEDHSESAVAQGLRSIAAAPLVAGERVVGVIVARSRSRDSFGARHRETLDLLAAQVGPAIHAAQLRDQLAQRLRELEGHHQELRALHEVSQAVLVSVESGSAAREILPRAMALAGCDLGAVQVADPVDGGIHRLIAEGFLEPGNLPEPRTGRSSDGLQVVREKTPQILEDLPSTTRFRTFQREGARSLIILPLVAGDHVLGLLQLASRVERVFPPPHVALLQAVANQLGMAIQKAQLYEELRRSYAELQATEQGHARLAAILEATPDLVATFDASFQRLYLNRAGRQLLGIDENASVGGDGLLAHRPEWARALLIQEAIPTAQRGGTWSGEAAYVNASGEEIAVLSVLIAHTSLEGQIEFYSTIARDIRERKALEERLLRAQRLEAAGRIAGQVAHDFNNLLAPLAGYPELIKLRLPPDHPTVQYCDAMLAAARRMAEINDDLLALGRRGHFERTIVDLNQIVTGAIGELGRSPPQIAFALDLDPDLLPIFGSAAQLLRVFENLIANAQDAMPSGGQLSIQTQNAYVDRLGGPRSPVPIGEYVLVEVRDTGGGIPPEIRDQVFDAFFTTKQTDGQRGSGLGLSVVQSVVEDHHGHVVLESEVGRGTTFRLYFPVSREGSAVPDVAGSVRGGGESILVVDDDLMQRDVSQKLLTSLGYRVHVAASGEEAVVYLKDHPMDLLVLDMVMPPGIDGAETYRQALALGRPQRAIVLSGFAESERVSAAQALGAGAYVRKPVSLETLSRAVQEELARADA